MFFDNINKLGKTEKMQQDFNEEKTYEQDIRFMREALKQAKKAYKLGEVPIGCVIVREGEIIARGYNKRNYKKNSLAHAEILAIDKACKKTGDWRLEECTMYITLEPCPMCAGAAVNSRLDEIVFGAYDFRAGATGSIANIPALPLNHRPRVTGGVMREECEEIMRSFFIGRR